MILGAARHKLARPVRFQDWKRKGEEYCFFMIFTNVLLQHFQTF